MSGSPIPWVPCPRKDDLYIRFGNQPLKTALVVDYPPKWIEGAHIFPIAHEQEWNARPNLLAAAAADSGSYFLSSHMKDSPHRRRVNTGPKGLNSLKNMLSMHETLHKIFDEHGFSICPGTFEIVPFRVTHTNHLTLMLSNVRSIYVNPVMESQTMPIIDALKHHWVQACRRHCRVNSN
ncbi:hypothetical protein DFH11DRAFT_149723 [Phellopilus nigrolimitatus]|nr:hypothetical protein DFH11DRAFT_149723 [Phellopilus nigrolimitatus]